MVFNGLPPLCRHCGLYSTLFTDIHRTANIFGVGIGSGSRFTLFGSFAHLSKKIQADNRTYAFGNVNSNVRIGLVEVELHVGVFVFD